MCQQCAAKTLLAAETSEKMRIEAAIFTTNSYMYSLLLAGIDSAVLNLLLASCNNEQRAE